MLRFFAFIACCFFYFFDAAAQITGPDNFFPETEEIELVLGIGQPIAESKKASCNYFVDDEDKIVEQCPSAGYTSAGTLIPQWAVPFQVQILTTTAAASNRYLKRKYPERPIWQSRHVCGGALIHNNWVLTAAHCFKDSQKAKHYGIRLKAESISEGLDKYEEIAIIKLHENYQRFPKQNDVALIKLKEARNARKFPHYYRSAGGSEMGYWQAFLTKRRKLIVNPPAAYQKNYFSVWDIKKGRLIYELPRQDPRDRQFVFDTEAELVYGVDHRSAWIFNFNSDRTVYRIPNTAKHTKIILSHDKSKMITWAPDGLIEIRQTKNRKLLKSIPAEFSIGDIVPYGDSLVLSDYNYGTHILDLKTLTLEKAEVIPGSFSPNNKFAIASYSQTPEILEVASGKVVARRAIPADNSKTFFIMDDALIAEDDSHFEIYDLKSLTLLRQIPKSEFSYYSHSNDWIIFLDKLGQTLVVEPKTGKDIGKPIASKYERNKTAGGLKIFDDRTKLLKWTTNGKTEIWDLSTGVKLHDIDHSLGVTNVKLSSDNKYIVGVSTFGPTDAFSVKSGEPVARIFHRATIDLDFVNDDRELLTWDKRGIAKLWSIKTGKQIGEVDIRVGDVSPPIQDIMVIDLADAEPPEHEALWAYGWGRTRNQNKRDPVSILRMIETYKISDSECVLKSGLTDGNLGDHQFCAFDPKRKTCRGDSGGPVISSGKLVGISSWGSGNCGDDEKPTGLSNVAHHKPWIVKIICNDPDEISNPSEFCTTNMGEDGTRD